MRFPPPFWTFEPQNRPQARSVSPFSPFFEAMLDFLTIFSAVGLQQELKKAHGEQSLVIREDDASPSSLVESAAGHIADAMDAFDTVVSESFGAFLGSPEESKPAPKKAWGRLGAPVVHAELPLHCLESLRLCILPRWHKDAEPDLWQRAASQSAICQVRKAQCERSFFARGAMQKQSWWFFDRNSHRGLMSLIFMLLWFAVTKLSCISWNLQVPETEKLNLGTKVDPRNILNQLDGSNGWIFLVWMCFSIVYSSGRIPSSWFLCWPWKPTQKAW